MPDPAFPQGLPCSPIVCMGCSAGVREGLTPEVEEELKVLTDPLDHPQGRRRSSLRWRIARGPMQPSANLRMLCQDTAHPASGVHVGSVLCAHSCGICCGLCCAVQGVLSRDIEVRVGVVMGPRRGLANFTRAIALDADVYREWRMDILAAAAPPCGGCAFAWVAEQALNVKSVMGAPPTNR